jgi:hypothetical protein
VALHPTGRWIVYREEDYWVAVHTTKQGCFAEADLWEELLPKMLEAEEIWDRATADRPLQRGD